MGHQFQAIGVEEHLQLDPGTPGFGSTVFGPVTMTRS